jgi:anti-sigma factor RsiW
VRALLEASPAVAARLAGWRRDAEGLRAALAGIETWTPNPSLDPAVIRRRMRTRSLQAAARTVYVSLALGAAALTGWWARGAYIGPPPRPMQEALDAYRAFASSGYAGLEHPAGQVPLRLWLAGALGLAHPLALPDLAARGFQPAGARLLPTHEGVAALVLYQADNGERIGYYLRPARHFIPGTRGWSMEDGLSVRYWYRGGYGYAVIGSADDPRIRQIERSFP